MEQPKYPVWRFHQDRCPDGLIVRSQEEDDKLGEGWVDSPSKFIPKEDADPSFILPEEPVPEQPAQPEKPVEPAVPAQPAQPSKKKGKK